MKDPNILAFTICLKFWKKGRPKSSYDHICTLIDIWHYQEPDGAPDWTYPLLSEKEKAKAADLIKNEVDNIKYWMQDCHVGIYNGKPYAEDVSEQEMIYRMERIFRIYKGIHRPWYKHPKWRFWQWRIQIIKPIRAYREFKQYVLKKHGWQFRFGLAYR